tara:strand:- start:2912 stop:3202 length:291 start_codon:yes stop_codon:yes gene_type:complete
MCSKPDLPEMPEQPDPLPAPPAPAAPLNQPSPLTPPVSASAKDKTKLKKTSKRAQLQKQSMGVDQLKIDLNPTVTPLNTGETKGKTKKKSPLNIPT